MKHNRHYATSPMPAPAEPLENGLRPDQVGTEGTDMFIQDERYLAAYAAVLRALRRRSTGSRASTIAMVMPQNEFNSTQPFPSCTWTPEGLARFVKHLGPEMEPLGVEVFLGTLERPDTGLLADLSLWPTRKCRRHVKGIGLQWAGKQRDRRLHRRPPGADALPDRAGVRRRARTTGATAATPGR